MLDLLLVDHSPDLVRQPMLNLLLIDLSLDLVL